VQERLESVARALQVLDPTIDLLELVDGGGGYRADVDNSGAQSRGQRGEVGQLIQSETEFLAAPKESQLSGCRVVIVAITARGARGLGKKSAALIEPHSGNFHSCPPGKFCNSHGRSLGRCRDCGNCVRRRPTRGSCATSCEKRNTRG
jgi:hypothetical protein